ncbi:anti-sigma factor family protein [Chloroflexota bacterium]
MFNFLKKQSCKNNQELLSAYIDKQLTGTEKSDLEQHLKTCETCDKELASLRNTMLMLKRLPVAVPRHSFTVKESRPVKSTPFFGIFRLATIATAAILLFINAGDFLGVYPTTVPPASPQATVPAFSETPAPVPVRRSSQGRPETSMPLPVGSSGDMMVKEVPAPGINGAATEPAGQYVWPVRQVEIGLIFMVIVLFLLTLVARKKESVKVKR